MYSSVWKILTIPVFGFLYVYTAIGVLLVIPLTWIKAKKPVQIMTMLFSRSVFLIMFKKLRIEGRENIDKTRNNIIIANHSSLFDILAIVAIFPEATWFGHERLLKIPVFRLYLKLIDYIPYKEPTIRNTRHMLEQLLEKGKDRSIAIFPEGTRTLNGRVNPFYRGFIYLLKSRNIGIQPVTLNGFYDLKPKNRYYIDFGSKLTAVIHKPIPREELIGKTDDEIIQTVKTIIESAYLKNQKS
ncbi:MAG TPA: lysophospholipid acyltransferase family protein [Bacteroidales bacterium]|nr:lysophospholipid acyltransferase family protein [Bacteroidales bacterium]HPF02379.1 lysophospholipid acyltransferase family protein [Bacteroidales bacterium]HPJ58938.1 lysophospholipid acyltransferase family protein [Bacteroidales bacterium]HPR12192.1 lysophospholipid acyltransferase family protein [Bacteroidales bacterium]HRW84875.1 lysophospholipid acyltransferase family protein [Bacteroidales bacterium]